MSGIAEILLNQGFKVTGSDLARSEVTERLENLELLFMKVTHLKT